MPVTPSIDPSIKVLKTGYWKGSLRTWSNRYYFDNLVPTTSGRWLALSDAVVNAEKAIYPVGQTIVGTVGYDAGSDVPVYSKVYATAATGSFLNAQNRAAETAILVRYSTSAMSARNHPIYLFNYYHGALGDSTTGASGADNVNPAQVTAMQTYANLWVAGFSDGTVTHHRCGPQGHIATAAYVHPYLHHRDFPRG